MHGEKLRNFFFSSHGAVAVPSPSAGMTDKLCTYGVEPNVSGQLKQVAFLLHQDRLVPSLQKMPHSVVPAVERLGVDAVKLTHSTRQIGLRRFNEGVIMVWHQAVGMAAPVVTCDDISQNRKERESILVVQEDVLASVAAAGDVINRALVFDTQWTCHTANTPLPRQKIKT